MLRTREFMASSAEQLNELVARELRLRQAIDRAHERPLPHDTVDFERISERARDRLIGAVLADRSRRENRIRELTSALQSVHARIKYLQAQTHDVIIFIPASLVHSSTEIHGAHIDELPQRKKRRKNRDDKYKAPNHNLRPLQEILQQRFGNAISLPYRCEERSNVIVGGVDLVSERGIKTLGHFSVQAE